MALQHYAGSMQAYDGRPVTEVDTIGNARPPHYAPPPPPPGFRVVDHRRTNSWELYRFRADAPASVAPAALLPSKLGDKDAAILVQTGDRP
jgi:hypothetical protein